MRDMISAEVGAVAVGRQDTLDLLLVAAAVGGHVLLEGPPGVAKTMLATVLARALGVEFRRAQFTPDMLPSDLTGTMTVVDGALAFRPGPIFTNVLLADEINRTPPKTQAALLEAMQEGHVTVDGTTRPLPRPFLVIATQNPVEFEGTYPLPEAQLDRFLMKLDVGYPDEETEHRLLQLPRRGVLPTGLDAVRPVVDAAVLAAAAAAVDAVVVAPAVVGYAAAVVRSTRTAPGVALGASPRAGVHLLAAARAAARMSGRDFVTPDDVAALAVPVLAHRIALRPEAEIEGHRARDVIGAVLRSVPVPR